MIIALETASTDISLAIAKPDGTLLDMEGWISDRRQGHETLPRLLDLLRRNGLELGDATALAVGTGPGSFTGLRVGMSLVKGMALALELPVFGVPSLEAWLAAEPEALGAVARAGAREAYLLVRGEGQARVIDRESLPGSARARPLVAPAELADAFGLEDARSPVRAAAAVATAAAQRMIAVPRGDDLERLEPTYIRAPRGVSQVRHAEVP